MLIGRTTQHPQPVGDVRCNFNLPRRQFLFGIGGIAALAAGALLPRRNLRAQVPAVNSGRIDVHSHFAPPAWVSAIEAKRGHKFIGDAEFLNAFKNWTPAKSIEQMDQAGIATSVVSITTPGIWFGDNDSPLGATRQLARQCNEYGARMAADFPGRFGLFAVLPLPDVEGSLHEIEHALDTLKADGFGLLTHYSETYGDKLLGDAAFAPVFGELNRRKAVVYIHRKISAGPSEIFGWDVHRTILSLLKDAGTGSQHEYTARFPDVRFIFCDAGGTMPFLIRRSTAPASAAGNAASGTETPLLRAVRQFYYGTGRSNNYQTITTLKQIVPLPHILFGTDYPYAQVTDEARGLELSGAFNSQELAAVYRENALALLPRFRR
jgi:predicted TIM-barrel fold metal-dependent hydrolase